MKNAIVLLSFLALFPVGAHAEAPVPLEPDLQTVVPLHVQLVNMKQREIIRFSNGIANTGDGPLEFRPQFPNAIDANPRQQAYQHVYNSDGTTTVYLASEFEFHRDHNHWHIDDVALFAIHRANPDGSIGEVFGDSSVKTTFCLVDWYKMNGPSRNIDRNYFACDRTAATQGISVGWVDQYNQAVPGQQLDITGAEPGDYYLVSTANPNGNFVEKNYDNNTAWVKFTLRRDSKGNPKITIIEHSPVDPDSPYASALAGIGAPNR